MAKTTSSVQYLGQKPEFGSRFLTEDQDVWTQNAWDHVPAPDDQDEIIAASLLRQRTNPVPDNDKQKYNDRPARHWDIFYKNNTANFFKNRKWLHQEFRELTEATEPAAGPVSIVEVGCGVGNSVFPLLSANSNPQLSLRAFDYSNRAIKLLQENPLYTSPPVGTIQAAVWDLTSPTLPDDLSPSSADILIMVFVFSALHPAEWAQAVANVHKILKPGGIVLFRDYGRYDLTQLRLKDRRLLENNFYIRGDNTRVYFFELDELALLFTGSRAGHVEAAPVVTEVVNDELNDSPNASGASTPLDPAELEELPLREQQIHPTLLSSPPPCLFSTEQLGVDRRLLVNRKRQIKMYRVWMQAKFRKLEQPDS